MKENARLAALDDDSDLEEPQIKPTNATSTNDGSVMGNSPQKPGSKAKSLKSPEKESPAKGGAGAHHNYYSS